MIELLLSYLAIVGRETVSRFASGCRLVLGGGPAVVHVEVLVFVEIRGRRLESFGSLRLPFQ